MTFGRGRLAGLAGALAVTARIVTGQTEAPPLRPHVMPVVYLPADLDASRDAIALQIRALEDVRAWYATRLAGHTFQSDPIVVQRSRHAFAELAGANFQNWWPLPAEEFASFGRPWNEHSPRKLLILAHGAGAWAGADSENGGIDSIAQAGRVSKGALGGLAVIGDSSIGGILAGVCPRDGTATWRKPAGGTAWWCNWNTYRGTLAHEMGHTWGLPHPDAFRSGLRCDSLFNSNMQCHWAWPADSLLPYEAAHLRSLEGFAAGADSAYRMLSSFRTMPSAGGSRVVRFERGDSILWAAGRGGGTGYPWGLEITADGASGRADISVEIAPSEWLVADLGRPSGDTGVVHVRVDADSRPIFDGELRVGTYPLELAAPLRRARRLRIRVAGVRSSHVLLGNARVYFRAPR